MADALILVATVTCATGVAVLVERDEAGVNADPVFQMTVGVQLAVMLLLPGAVLLTWVAATRRSIGRGWLTAGLALFSLAAAVWWMLTDAEAALLGALASSALTMYAGLQWVPGQPRGRLAPLALLVLAAAVATVAAVVEGGST